MLEHHRHPGDRFGHPFAAAPDLALIDRQKAVYAAQQRGLAASRWTDDRQDLALSEIEIDAAKDLERTVPLGKSADPDAGSGPAGCADGRCTPAWPSRSSSGSPVEASASHVSARFHGAMLRSIHLSAAVSATPRNISRMTGANVLSISKMLA